MFFDIISPLIGLPPISILLQALVNKYLSNSYCLALVMDKPIDFNFQLSFTYIIPGNRSTVDELTKQLLEVSEKGCSDYIVYMSDPQKFMAAFDQTVHQGNVRRSNRKIILLPFISNVDYVSKSLKLFSLKESTFVANMLLVLPNNPEKSNCELYDLFTHEFIKLNYDQPLYLDQWNSCTQKFDKMVNLFPHDMKNLNGRVVRVAGFTYPLFAYLNLDAVIEPSQRDGLDIRVVDEFCRWVNCTIEIVDVKNEQWGQMFENGTGVGVLGNVALDRADIGIAAIYPWYDEYLYLDFSTASLRSAVICIAPSPRLLASWAMPLEPFSWYIWYAVVITFIFASIGLIIAKGSMFNVFLIIFGIMISQSQPQEVKSWHIRSITGWILAGSLILVSAYSAGLAATFTVPKYEPSIDTIQNLVDRKMEWGATHDAWTFSFSLSTEPLIKQLVSQFRVYSYEELKKRSFTRDLAFSIEKLPAGYFSIGDYITTEASLDLTIMSEDFYFGNTVLAMRKSSVYNEKISELIGRLHESGLFLAWETQVAIKYLNFKVQQVIKLSRSSRADTQIITALNVRQLVGVYILYILGVGIATLVCLMECFAGKVTRRATRFNH